MMFQMGEGQYRESIEGGYASMAHFLSRHPNPFGWNPYQYGGLPTAFWYLPSVPYGGAVLAWLFPSAEPYWLYRVLVSGAGCLGPVAMFLFVLAFTRDRRWAAAAGVCYSLFSVSYMLYDVINKDRGLIYLPWRMQALHKYGEGPHTTGLTLLPLALIACWRAGTGRRYGQIFAAAVLMAAVALTNWIASLAMGWCCLMMIVANLGAAHETGFLARRLLAAAGLAYLMACFWLTPRFIQTTMFNWPADAFGYKVQWIQYVLWAGLAGVTAAIRLAFRRWPRRSYACFAALCLGGFLYITGVHYWFRLDTIPESRRYALEVEFFFFVLAAEWARHWLPRTGWRRDVILVLAGCLIPGAFWQLHPYLLYSRFTLFHQKKETTPEYKVAEFLSRQRIEGRVYVSGGTRFRLNSWFLIPQLGGTFESGLRNRVPLYIDYYLRTGGFSKPGERGADATMLLRISGVQYMAVHGPKSREHWRDIKNPDEFAASLEEVFRDGDDVVYRVPFTSLASLVKPSELPGEYVSEPIFPIVRSLAASLDDTARPAIGVRWSGPSRFTVSGDIPPQMLLSVRVNYDGGWRASQNGRPVELRPDNLGNIVAKPDPGAGANIEFEFHPHRQQLGMTAISATAWILSVAGLWRARRRERLSTRQTRQSTPG